MSSINPLSSNLLSLLSNEPLTVQTQRSPGAGTFADIFTESLNTSSITDTADKFSAVELLTGQADDMSGLLLDANKAELALRLTVEIRNKLVEAYNDIMRMQV